MKRYFDHLQQLWRQPPNRISLILLFLAGAIGGVIFWGGFNTFMEYSNSMDFCLSCHEMRTTVYQEYKKTTHYQNTSGVQAICSDCHVPRPWGAKLWRKTRATFKELPHKIMGTIDTPEKFEAKRLELAESVWAEMRSNNSRECRNCHSMQNMILDKQKQRAKTQHEDALKTGETCIDCHQGIAHKKPEQEEKGGNAEGDGFAL